MSTGYWLLKSEPDVFSWSDLEAKGPSGEEWTGVRNYLARNNMRAMRLGDLGFFYHSNIGLEIVGICEIATLAHPDSSAVDDPRWECVDVRAICPLPRPVALKAVKENEKLAQMSLVTSMRLSVQPVTAEEWAEVCRMGGLDPAKVRVASQPRRQRKTSP
ncbi:MAG: EVE domain-containing protein [Hyphomicrobiaceae bacterium]|nr:EVE domain-containing protein [Hyphomicrobiaceae bacterium]